MLVLFNSKSTQLISCSGNERTFSDALAGFSLKEKLGWELGTLGHGQIGGEILTQPGTVPFCLGWVGQLE